MFCVYHVDKYTRVFLKLVTSLEEGKEYIKVNYAGRYEDGKDTVIVVDERDQVQYSIGVKWMPQFEAVSGFTKTYPSSSSSTTYKTQLNTTDIISCDCRAWTMGWKKTQHPLSREPYRHCKHTDDFVHSFKLEVQVRGQYLMLLNKKLQQAKAALKRTPSDVFAGLVAAYEKAIDYMASLDPDKMLQAAPAVEQAKFKVEVYLMKLEQQGIDGSAQLKAANAKLRQVIS